MFKLKLNPPPMKAKRPMRSRRCTCARSRRAALEFPPMPSAAVRESAVDAARTRTHNGIRLLSTASMRASACVASTLVGYSAKADATSARDSSCTIVGSAAIHRALDVRRAEADIA